MCVELLSFFGKLMGKSNVKLPFTLTSSWE